MYHSIIGPAVLIFIIVTMLLFLYIGVRISTPKTEQHLEKSPGMQIIEGAVFALMGLLIAFTFSAASTKFDAQRHLIIEEANAFNTAYLRLDLAQSDKRDELRDYFKQYLKARLDVYQKLPDIEAAKQDLDKTKLLQEKIWKASVQNCEEGDSPFCMHLLPALNTLFEIANTRFISAEIHPPFIVLFLLVGVALISSLLAGYNIGNKDRGSILFVLSYTAIMATTIYIILDMEYPRLGLIRVDDFDQVLKDLLTSLA